MIAKKTLPDYWLAAKIKFLALATSRSSEGSISRQFLAEARIRYRQYRRSGDPLMRYSCWSAIQISLRSLEKEAALTSTKTPTKERAKA
jgi:hypothetical protein